MGSLMQADVPQPTTPLEETIMDAPIASFHPPVAETVPEGTPLRAAVARMQEKNIGYLLVTGRRGELVGIFTERDVLCKVAGQDVDLETPVDTFMTPNPTALRPSVPIAQALHLMAVEPGYRYLPLVDDAGRPQGLLSFRRVLTFIENVAAPG
jgi:CBS domain-containing protein